MTIPSAGRIRVSPAREGEGGLSSQATVERMIAADRRKSCFMENTPLRESSVRATRLDWQEPPSAARPPNAAHQPRGSAASVCMRLLGAVFALPLLQRSKTKKVQPLLIWLDRFDVIEGGGPLIPFNCLHITLCQALHIVFIIYCIDCKVPSLTTMFAAH